MILLLLFVKTAVRKNRGTLDCELSQCRYTSLRRPTSCCDTTIGELVMTNLSTGYVISFIVFAVVLVVCLKVILHFVTLPLRIARRLVIFAVLAYVVVYVIGFYSTRS